MRFIFGALTGLVVLLLGAVSYAVLTPMDPAGAPVRAAAVDAPSDVTAGPDTADADLASAKTEAPGPDAARAPDDRSAAALPPRDPRDGPVLPAPPTVAALDLAGLAPADPPMLRPVAWLPPVSPQAPQPPAADTQPASPVDLVYVTGNRVNMRAGPGSRHDWLATLSRGDGLVLIEKQDRWYKVQADVEGRSVTGWMAAGFLSEEQLDA